MTAPREPDARKIDAEVAERIFGWHRVIMEEQAVADEIASENRYVWRPDFVGSFNGKRTVVPAYSTNIADAMAVLEKMRERGWGVRMLTSDGWQVLLSMPHGHHNVGHESLPMAICLAALRAVDAERKD